MGKLFKFTRLLICFILVFFLFGCSKDNQVVEVSGIMIDSETLEDEYEIGYFDLVDFSLIIEYSDNSTTSIVLDSSMISSDDLAKLQTIGTHNISVNYENFSAIISVTIIPPINGYTVTFSGDGGVLESGTESQQIMYGEGAVAPIYTKEYNDFLQWDIIFDNVTESITVTAQWQPYTYSVIFRSDNGYLESGEENQIIDHGSSAIPPVYYRDDGYALTGWDYSYDNITEDIIITALWERSIYTVTFTLDGGTLVSGDLVQELYYSYDTVPPVIEKTGYIFYEWYTSDDVVFWDTPCNHITEDRTISPIWIEIIAPTPGLTFQAVGDDLEVSGYTGTETTVFIPSYYNGKWVKGIGENALVRNEVIEILSLQHGIEYIAFQGLAAIPNMHTLNLPNTLQIIENFGLGGNINLTNFIIPESLNNIGYGAIDEMHSISAFIVDEKNTAYKSIDGILYTYDETILIMYPGARVGDLVLPIATEIISDSAFSSCGLIESITFNENITTIPLLQSCESLSYINVHPDNPNFKSIDGILYNKTVTTLIKIPRAMSGDIIIPETVTNIFEFGCSEAYNITSIEFLSPIPPTLGVAVFSGINRMLIIYVPSDSINAYKVAPGWSDIESHIQSSRN